MSLKAALSKPFASLVESRLRRNSLKAAEIQGKIFKFLLENGSSTQFGKNHNFSTIHSYQDFKKNVPVRDYEGFKPYMDSITNGEVNVLWKGKPLYLSKTSGTTSGAKYIPITRDSISNHIHSARNALLTYIARTGKNNFVNGKMIFLSGNPELSATSGIPTGRLSGIVNHHVPGYLRKNQLPSYQTNCIEDWEMKVEKIAEETLHEKMTLISGIPSWVQMYFDKLISMTGKKTIAEIFPGFSLFVYGGVNFEPYRKKFETTIGKKVDSIELYPASEGFIAFQDEPDNPGLLLIIDSGIFYEFVPASEFFSDNPARVSLKDVELNVNYVIILNTNAGLWGYNIGDTVKFVSRNPYRLLVTGRIKHFTSAFGEHVIAEEVEYAIKKACEETDAEVIEFTLAPQVSPAQGELPYHEWFIEFSKAPADMESFRRKVDIALQGKNIYYRDLIEGKVLQPLIIRQLQRNAFISYMKSKGKLGGQNKVPRLSNDRSIADELKKYVSPA